MKNSIFIVLFAVVLRLVPVWGGAFPFMYDHARDSLAIWEMWELMKPALLGAQTSIPGLYYGPVWYYLALPLNIVLDFHPIAGVLTTILFAALAVYVASRVFDSKTSLLMATSVGLVGAQQSSWSPYLTSITSLIILVLAQAMSRSKDRQHVWLVIALVATLSLSFHFQPAFAVVQLPLVLFALRSELKRYRWQQLLIFAGVFAAPFLPQVLFEFRHDFHQTAQLWLFISQYGAESARVGQNATGFIRVIEIGKYVIESATSALPVQIPLAGGALIGVFGWQWWRQRDQGVGKTNLVLSLSLLMIVGSFLLYLVLPAKSYYFVGLIPYWVVVLATVVNKFCIAQKQVVAAISILATVQLWQSFSARQEFLQTQNAYAAKQAVVKKITEISQGKPFVAYHYIPELYDYTYQILHYRQQMANPAYQPVEISYEPEKTLYLDEYSTAQWSPAKSKGQSEQTFLVVEVDDRRELVDAWWDRVSGGQKVVASYTITPTIMLYVVKQEQEE
ncbi:MAG: hypothetical protein O2840_03535 [bacterium]|nr:hypothetical protein [bacterium]